MSDFNIKLDRRAFLKALAAAGATTAFVAAVGPRSVLAQGPVADQPIPEYVSALTGSAYGKSVALATAGPGGNRNWQPGDSIKFLPQDKIPVSKVSDAFAALPKDKLLTIYQRMVTSRKWETMGKDIFLGGKDDLYGYFHMYIGEESVANAACAALNSDDFITSTHRGHGDIIAKGADINKMALEIFASKDGYNKGYGLSMHIVDMSLGIMGTNGIVGGGWLLATGAALSAKINKTQQVAVCFAGDGAANSRYFFNSVRNSVTYKLPYIAFIVNNFYNAGTAGARDSAVKYQAELAKGLGIPCTTVEGNDVTAVYQVTKDAVDRARAGNGPSVIEALTFRWYDHQGFAGAKAGVDGAFGLPYRSDDEVRQWMSRDGIVRYRNFLIDRKIATADELTKLEGDVQVAVQASWDIGRKGAKTTPEMGLQNTWASATLEATQFFDRKGTATAWAVPEYMKGHVNNLVLPA
jgi:acetoin:2,6-dichlorophenolindophenol oxidoreductase subunit alpha